MRTVSHRWWALALALALGACTRTDPAQDQPTEPASVQELRERVRALEKQKGEDAYTDPAVDGILAQLDQVPQGSTEYEDARRLSAFLWAKRRLAHVAQNAERTEEVVLEGSRGPVQMKGEAPSSPEEVQSAQALKAGTPRAQLLSTLGSCLVRETWFRGTGGGPTTELFHIHPSCRERLGQHVYTVADDRVMEVRPGNLDGLMTTRVPDDLPLGGPKQ